MVFLDFTGTDTTFVVVNLSSILLVTTVVASALVSLSGTETFVLYCNVTACLILLVNVILPVVTESIVELVNNFQNYWNTTISKLNELPEDSFFKSEKVIETIKEIGDNIKNIDLKKYINHEKITEYVKGALGVASGIFDVFVTIIVSVYILLQRTQIVEFFKNLAMAIFGEKTCKKISEYVHNSNYIFFKFISLQLIDSVVVGILVTVALSIIGV